VERQFTEYCDIKVTDPLRQGDILEAVDPQVSRWRRHLFVITADCDFANQKNHGRVTCIPVLTSEEYLLEMYVPRLYDRLADRLVGIVRSCLADATIGEISADRLRAWPAEVDVEEIMSTLQMEGKKSEEVRAAFNALGKLAQPAPDFGQSINQLIDAHLAGPSPRNRGNVVRQITDFLKQPFGQPPGDALFLSTIAPGHELGYFAYLRHLEQPSQDRITLGPAQRDSEYRRIAHLSDRYTHALVQRFAMVFMSIGLPREYEEVRDLHSEILGENFS
jgi:hypothetical protein